MELHGACAVYHRTGPYRALDEGGRSHPLEQRRRSDRRVPGHTFSRQLYLGPGAALSSAPRTVTIPASCRLSHRSPARHHVVDDADDDDHDQDVDERPTDMTDESDEPEHE